MFLSFLFTKGSSYLFLKAWVLFAFLKHGVLEGGLEVIMLGFVEAVHVELPYKTVHFIVPEIFGQDDFLEFGYVFNGEFCSVRGPVDDFDKINDLF